MKLLIENILNSFPHKIKGMVLQQKMSSRKPANYEKLNFLMVELNKSN